MANIKLTEQQMKAVEKVAKYIGIEKDDIQGYLDDDTITINAGRNGREVAWCIWSENTQCCVYVDTLKELDEEEIEEQFC